jgi:hypothetical protein
MPHASVPVLTRQAGVFNLATFMRTQLFASLATLRIGMNVLQKRRAYDWTGCWHTAACSRPKEWHRASWRPRSTPLSLSVRSLPRVGPGASLYLAAFVTGRGPEQGLTDYLNTGVFADSALDTVQPEARDVAGFDAFIQRFVDALPVERAAVDHS